MDSFFKDYNELQLDAIKSEKKRICVYAGPGTGKTKTLVGKYVYLQKEMGVLPANILCLTFTKKAAEEMEEKIQTACGDNRSKYIGTIHSMGHKILSQDIYKLGFPNKYSIITDDDMHVILGNIMSEMNLYENDDITYRDLAKYINKAKGTDKCCTYFNYLIDSNLCEETIRDINEKILQADDESLETSLKYQKVYYLYLLCQANNYYLDFQDLILYIITYSVRTNSF